MAFDIQMKQQRHESESTLRRLVKAISIGVMLASVTASHAAPVARSRAPAPLVSPDAERMLKAMGSYLGSANAFTVHADVTFDHLLPSGQKLQFSANEEIVLQRPGRLYVEWDGDLGTRQLWLDGRSITLYDPAMPFYATVAAPADIDKTLDMASDKLNFAPPLADLFYRDPYGSLRRNIQYGVDLGQTDVGGRNCRSFAFVEKTIDWQIWIENGPQPVPCKIVITYKTHPAQPQFTAVFSDWDFAPRISPQAFTPDLPSGTEKIPFEQVAASK